MIKYIGLILIVTACSAAGYLKSEMVRQREKQLRAVASMLCECTVMLNFNAATRAEIIDSLCGKSELECLGLKDFIEGNGRLLLSSDELCEMRSFFDELGSTDLTGQLAMVEKHREYFGRRIAEHDKESAQKCRLYRTMGIMSGVFIAVILV